jgi:hypothetical protein
MLRTTISLLVGYITALSRYGSLTRWLSMRLEFKPMNTESWRGVRKRLEPDEDLVVKARVHHDAMIQAEKLADAVEDYLFTEGFTRDNLKAAWQDYVNEASQD